DLGITNQPPIEGFSNNHSLIISQPLDKDYVWTADAALNFRRISQWFNNEQTHQDDITSLSFGLNFNKYDRWGRTYLRFQTDVAPKEFMKSNVSFWKASVYGNRVTRLPFGAMWLTRATAQFTPDSLPTAEAYQIGGAFSVRGYTEGLLLGDRGYNISNEI